MRIMSCPQCGGTLTINFGRKFKDIAHMIALGEWVSLESFPISVTCNGCPYLIEGVGREFTINIERGEILRGRIDTEKDHR